MKRHATDMVSLVFGSLFIFIAAWWAIDRYVNVDIDLPRVGWIAAAALIVLGVIGVVASLRGDRTPAPASAAPVDEASDPWLMTPVPPAPPAPYAPGAPLPPIEPLAPAEPLAPPPPFEPRTPQPPASSERISGAASYEPSTAEEPTFDEPTPATGDGTEEPTSPAKPDH
jgi:hypothetical protein